MPQPLRRGRGRPPRDPMSLTSQAQQQKSYYLQKKEQMAQMLQTPIQKQEPGAPQKFVCTLCQKEYDTSPALYLHMKMKHQAQAQEKKEKDEDGGEGPGEEMLLKKRGRPRAFDTGVYVH